MVIASLAALLWMALRWYHPGHVIAYIDLFPVYTPMVLFAKTVWAWSHASSPFGRFGLPTFSTYYLLYSALIAITNAGMAQALLFWLFLAMGWLGVFALCRSLGLGVTAAFFAGWAYTLNPFAQCLVGFNTASTEAATLPWIYWMIHRAAIDRGARPLMTAIAVASSFLVLCWIASTPQLFFELILLTVPWCVFMALRSDRGFLAWLAASVALCVVASAWWLVPVGVAILSNSVTHATLASFDSWTFSNSSLLNDMRFLSTWAWQLPYYFPYSHGYDANVFTYAAGFWGIVLLCAGFLFIRSAFAPIVRFFAAVVLVAIFIEKGPHEPLGWVNLLIYHIPGFVLLIQPAGLTIGALLAAGVVAGVVIEELLRAARASRPAAIAAGAVMVGSVAAALFAASPLLNGLMFSGARGDSSDYVAIPNYWRQASSYLASVDGNGSVLVLPVDDFYQQSY
ncbi:MAG: hypothetical protein JO199_12085, partial [Candidatus Eremiobacteraeota bacterium]|nr:hypothetical protein [Candidatus Eremiobacteraeota bacterium]